MNFPKIKEKLKWYRDSGADPKLMNIVDEAFEFVDRNSLLENESCEKEDEYHNQRMNELSSETQKSVIRLEKAFEAIEDD